MHKLVIGLLGVALCACTPNYYKQALKMAGNNRSQLEQVVAHYQETGESLKVKAARYLIANMEGKQSAVYADPAQCEQILRTLDSIYTAENMSDAAIPKMHQYVTAQTIEGFLVNDLEFISARYLIQQIDSAFETWERTGWHTQYPFDLFCEHMLPYKVASKAPLEDWRTDASAGADALDDSLQQIENPMLLARRLLANAGFIYDSEVGSTFPYSFGFKQLKLLPYGDCIAMGNLGVYYARSRGIPCSSDINMAWANRSAAHAWPVVLMPDGSHKTLTYYMTDYSPLSHKDHEQGWYFKASKVYRNTYSVPRMNAAYRLKDKEPVHSQFIWLTDVTRLYRMPLFTAKVTLTQPLPQQLVYLSTFNNALWVPVACAQRKGKKVEFPDMGVGVAPEIMNLQTPFVDGGEGIVFLPVQFNGEDNIAVAPPFILDTLGIQHPLMPDFSELHHLTITRKYPESQDFYNHRGYTAGLRLQASQTADCSRTRHLLTVEKMLDSLYQPFALAPGESCRYVRMEADTNLLEIAEAVFYDTQGNRLHPAVLDGKGTECVDGDILSSFHEPNPGPLCIRLDFGRPVQLARVELATRNDDNEIVPGFLYELQYWNGEWIPLERQTARAHFLNFDNLPSNALFRLHCLSGGKEERIFTVPDDKPLWW